MEFLLISKSQTNMWGYCRLTKLRYRGGKTQVFSTGQNHLWCDCKLASKLWIAVFAYWICLWFCIFIEVHDIHKHITTILDLAVVKGPTYSFKTQSGLYRLWDNSYTVSPSCSFGIVWHLNNQTVTTESLSQTFVENMVAKIYLFVFLFLV